MRRCFIEVVLFLGISLISCCSDHGERHDGWLPGTASRPEFQTRSYSTPAKPGALAPVRVILSRSIITYAAPSVRLVERNQKSRRGSAEPGVWASSSGKVQASAQGVPDQCSGA
jgi:hypothetical protein